MVVVPLASYKSKYFPVVLIVQPAWDEAVPVTAPVKVIDCAEANLVAVAAFPVILLEVKAIVPVASGNVKVLLAVKADVTKSPYLPLALCKVNPPLLLVSPTFK